jgi:hypothetical protein
MALLLMSLFTLTSELPSLFSFSRPVMLIWAPQFFVFFGSDTISLFEQEISLSWYGQVFNDIFSFSTQISFAHE